MEKRGTWLLGQPPDGEIGILYCHSQPTSPREISYFSHWILLTPITARSFPNVLPNASDGMPSKVSEFSDSFSPHPYPSGPPVAERDTGPLQRSGAGISPSRRPQQYADSPPGRALLYKHALGPTLTSAQENDFFRANRRRDLLLATSFGAASCAITRSSH